MIDQLIDWWNWNIGRMIARWWNWITDRPIAIYILIFTLSAGLVVLVSSPDYDQKFWYNVKVEAHGMLFDILILGLLFSWLHSSGEKRRLIQRYKDEIDDFRGWESEEAARRIRGNILRLNREGVNKINLRSCFLKGAVLEEANLTSADLSNADLRKTNLKRAKLEYAKFEYADLGETNLREANLRRANFRNANLQGTYLTRANLSGATLMGAELSGAKLLKADLKGAWLLGANLWGVQLRETSGLTVESLCEAKTLYQAKNLDPELEKQIKEKCPHLLEIPEKPDKIDE